jgi:hypothetical protein
MKLKRPVLTVFVAGLLLLIAVIAVWRLALASANKDRLQAIAARGEPTSLAELDKFYKSVSDQSNAALFWLEGSSALTNGLGDIAGKLSIKRGVALNHEELEDTAQALAANAQALGLFEQAAKLDQSRYPINLSQQPFTNIFHLSALKGAAQVLRARAAVAVAQTNTTVAAEALAGILAAGRSMAAEPVYISQVVAYAIDAIGIQALQFALNTTTFNEPQLAAIQRAVARSDDPESAARGLIGERVFFISSLANPSGYVAAARGMPPTGIEEIVSETLVLPITKATGFWLRDMRFGIDALTTNIAFARLPDPQRFHSATNSSALTARAKSRYYIMSGLLLPALERYALRDANHRAQLRTAFVGLAVERFRLAHDGKTPADISSLMPAYLDKVPVDPYDGQLLRYKPIKNGYVVYSIGPDAKDDGGTERVPKAPKGAPEDVTFIVEREQ